MGNSREDNLRRIRDLINRGCSAFVILGIPIGERDLLNLIEENGIEYVSFNNEYSRNDLTVDYGAVYLKYAKDILKNGAKRTAYVMVDKYYQKYCRDSALFLNRNGVRTIFLPVEDCDRRPFDCSDMIFDQSFHAVDQALSAGETAECWIFAYDYGALGALKALRKHGLMERMFRLYGLNDTRAGRFSVFPVNTSDLMLEEQVSWLLRHLKSTQHMHKILIPEVFIRS